MRPRRCGAPRRGHARRPRQPPPVPAAALPGRRRASSPRARSPRRCAASCAGRRTRASCSPRSPASTSTAGRARPRARRRAATLAYDSLIVAAGASLLLRPRRVGAGRAGPQDAGRRPRGPEPDPARVRARRARGRPGRAGRLAALRGDRRRPDRHRARRADRRALARHAAPRLPPHRHRHGGDLAARGRPALLPTWPEELSARAEKDLGELGVDVRRRRMAVGVDDQGVDIVDAERKQFRVPARTVLWAGGVAPSPLARSLGAELDRAGRVIVEQDLTAPVARCSRSATWPRWTACPGIAPAAMQQGRHAARTIRRRLAGREAEPFRYLDKGSLAVIGHGRAVGLAFGVPRHRPRRDADLGARARALPRRLGQPAGHDPALAVDHARPRPRRAGDRPARRHPSLR